MPRYLLLNKLIDKFCNEDAVGIEIGVHHAETSIFLAKNCKKLKTLYCIDPYIDRDHRYFAVSEELHQYYNVVLLRMKSTDAALFVNQPLDFIFIDGDHSSEAVMQDLQNWVPKLKSGGLLTGHDWCRERIGVVIAGTQYLLDNYFLFRQTYSQEKLDELGLSDDFIVGANGLIHKQRHSGWPFWWRIKQ